MDSGNFTPFAPINTGTTTASPVTPEGTPDYLLAADLHNLGSQKTSWFDSTLESLQNAPDYMKASALSGINSFYNSGLQVGRVLGLTNEPERDTAAWISSIDSNLGQYYNKDPGSADVMGFLLSSVIPGLGGIKILNAGQKALNASKLGFVGGNIGAAMGLRTPAIETYIATAANEIANGQAIYTKLGASGVKALTVGIYQNVLEGIAFETAIQATLQASPILKDQTKSDILWNVATGGLFQGVLGGAFHAASTYGKISNKVIDAVKSIREPGERPTIVATGKTAMEISQMSKSLEESTAAFQLLDKTGEHYAEQVKSYEAMKLRVNNAMRAKVHDLVSGYQKSLGNMFADLNVGEVADNVVKLMADTDEITHLYGVTRVERAINEAIKLEKPRDPSLQVQYIKLTGEDSGVVLKAGTTLESGPPVFSIADMLGEGKSSLRDRVMSHVRGQKHSINDLWDATKMPLTSAIGHITAEGRYIWANSNMLSGIKEGTRIHRYDIPVLQRAYRDGVLDITVVGSSGNLVKDGFGSMTEMANFIEKMQDTVVAKLGESSLKQGEPFRYGDTLAEAQNWVSGKIAKIANVKVGALEKTAVSGSDDYKAWQSAQGMYQKYLETKGLKFVKDEEIDPRFLPTWAKVSKKLENRTLPDGTVLDAITHFATTQQITQEAVDRLVAKTLRELSEQLPVVSNHALSESSVMGTGATLATFSNPGQGTLGSLMSAIGSVTQRAAAAAKRAFTDLNEGELANLARNQESVIEWGSLTQKVSRSPRTYHIATLESGEKGLVSAEVLAATKGGKVPLTMELVETQEGFSSAEHFIQIHNDETWNLLLSHGIQTNKLQQVKNELAAVRGKTTDLVVNHEYPAFRPIPPDPKDYKYYVFVKDPKVTAEGHTSMIFAQTPEKLAALVQKAKDARPDLDIRTSSNTRDFFRARGSYEYDQTLSENYLNGALKKEGIYSDYFLKTDPQAVVDEYLTYHTRQIDTQTRMLVREKYQAQFAWLEDQAVHYGGFDTSKIGGNIDALEATAKNPYLSYIKTALNLSRANENPLWYGLNRSADSAVSNAVAKVKDIWRSVKGQPGTPEFEEAVKNTNANLQTYGLNTGYVDAATQLIINEKIPQGQLSRFVTASNSLLARLVLGLDPLNALTNATGANILRMTELKQLLDAAKKGDAKIAGKLAQLVEVDMTGAGDVIWSPAKLNARGVQAYFKSLFGDGKEIQHFKDLGVIRDISEQFKLAIDNLTLKGSETTQELNPRLAKAKEIIDNISQKGEKWTGNKHAEEMNRFITAWGMKSLTDPLVQTGRMSTAEQYAYINTHVNRVEGNMIASQRPFIFQGAIGQSLGLFQSYQFNLMQQMFRYVAEGTKKDAAMLLGLQGTFFGIQGLPAFQAINQHVIGTASGNTNHTDIYDIVRGAAGKNMGDLLLYGLPSNLLQTNMYSRGDINPRQITIIPNSLDQIPVISATMKMFSGMKDSLKRVANGANFWQSMLQGIEHTSINRPLAGLAQTLQAFGPSGQAYSTTQQGGILFSNDLMSLATLSRISGGRPLDEAIVNDEIFKIHSYNSWDHDKMVQLAEAIKTSNIQGQEMDGGQISKFAEQYARNGGRQINFNRFMVNEIKAAKQSEAERIMANLNSPYSQRMQGLMGGGASQTPSILNVPLY